MQKILSKKKDRIVLLGLAILVVFLIVGGAASAALLAPGGGGILSPGFFTLDGDGIRPSNSAFTIGTEENPWLGGFFTAMNASTSEITTLTISGASAGTLDMGGFAITNGGTFTAAIFSSTSTSATNLGIGTTSPTGGEIVVDGSSGTGTIRTFSANELTGGCLELKSMIASTSFRLIATTTGPAILEEGTCE